MARALGVQQIGAEAILIGTPQFLRLAKHVEDSLKQMNKSAQRLERDSTRAFQNLATSVAASMAAATVAISGATVALGSLVGLSVSTASAFEANMSIVRAITGGTEASLGRLRDTAREVAQTTVISMSAVAEATGELARGGISLESAVQGATKAVVDLSIASAGELELGRSAILVATALNAFNLQGTEAASVANAMTAAAQKSAITFVDVQRSFQQAAAVAAASGLTYQELAATIGVLGVAGLRGSDAGTSLKQALIQLAKPSKQAAELMNEYGISLFDATGTARPFRDLIIDLQNQFGDYAVASGKITEAERNRALATIFGSDAIRAALVLAQQGVGVFDDMVSAQTDASFSAAHLASVMQDNLNSQLTILQNNIGQAAEAFGSTFIPIIRGAVDALNAFIRSVDPKALELVGLALRGLFDPKILGEFIVRLNQIAGPEIATRVQEVVAILLNIKLAIQEQLLPAFGELKDTIIGAFPEQSLEAFVASARNVSSEIRRIAEVAVTVIATIQKITENIIASSHAADVLRAALFGLIAIPIATLAILFTPLIAALTIATLKASLFVVAIGVIVTNFEVLRDAAVRVINTGLTPFVDIINGRITPATVALGAALLFIANVVLVRLATSFTAWAAVTSGQLATVAARVALIQAVTVSTFVTTLPRALGASITAFVVLAQTATAASVAIAAALTRVAIGAIVALGAAMTTVAAAIVTATGPVIAIVAVAAAAIAAFAVAWHNNWLNIQAIVQAAGQVIAQVIDRMVIRPLMLAINVARQLPVVGAAVSSIGDTFESVSSVTSGLTSQLGNLKDVVTSTVPDVEGLLRSLNEISIRPPAAVGIADFSDEIENARQRLAEAEQPSEDLEKTLRQLRDTASTTAGSFDQLGGAAKKAKEEAGPAIAGFTDAITKAIRLQGFIDEFGDAGAKAIDSLVNAVVSNLDKDGARVGEALHDFVQELRKAEVTNWQELGHELITQFSRALIERTDEAIAAAKHVLSSAADAMKAQGALTVDTFRRAFSLASIAASLGNEGAQLMENLRLAIVEGGTKAIRAVGTNAHAVVLAFAKELRPEQAVDFTTRFMNSLIDVIRSKTPEAVSAFENLLARFRFDTVVLSAANAREDAIARAVDDYNEAVMKVQKNLKAELDNLELERSLRRQFEAGREAINDFIEATLEGLRSIQEHRRRDRELEREDRDQRIKDTRAAEDLILEREKQMEEAIKARRKRLEQQLKGTPVGGLGVTAQRGTEEDDEVKRLRKRWAEEDARAALEKKRAEEDRTRRRADEAEDVLFELDLKTQLTRRQRELEADLRAFIEAEDLRQFERQKLQTQQRADEAIEQELRRLEEVTREEDKRFNKIVEQLELQRRLADVVFDGLLDDLQDAIDLIQQIVVPNPPRIPQFAQGGIVPGPIGRPTLAVVHGGEEISSVSRAERTRASTSSIVNTVNNTYQVNASYANVQSEASVLLDLEALVALAGR